jgi:hypothetical protein
VPQRYINSIFLIHETFFKEFELWLSYSVDKPGDKVPLELVRKFLAFNETPRFITMLTGALMNQLWF